MRKLASLSAIIFLALVTATLAATELVGFEINAVNGNLTVAWDVNASNLRLTKSTLEANFWGTPYGGMVIFSAEGSESASKVFIKNKFVNFTRVVQRPLKISFIMNNTTSCTSFVLSNISCDGTGLLIIKEARRGNLTRILSNFTQLTAVGGKVNITASNSSQTIFQILDMKITRLFPARIIDGLNGTLKVFDSLGQGGNLTFEGNVTPSQTVYANNTIVLKNAGPVTLNVYISGQDFPGTVEFRLTNGTEFNQTWNELRIFDNTTAFGNGTKLGGLLPNHIFTLFFRMHLNQTSVIGNGTLKFEIEQA